MPLALVPNNEFALGQNHNEYPSLGISPNGTLGYAWHRGACCGGFSPINAPNKVMFARSTDGGVSFPFSTTIVTVPLNQTVPFNSTSPLGVRWSDTPNIAADPATNGTFYAVWTQYRTPSTAASAAIYLSKTTDNGATWSAPVIPYNNPNANIFQGFGWVKVTTDHAVHVTFTGGTTSNTTVAQFYVQSTDGGATWSAPFQLSATTFGPFGITTDYEAMDVSGDDRRRRRDPRRLGAEQPLRAHRHVPARHADADGDGHPAHRHLDAHRHRTRPPPRATPCGVNANYVTRHRHRHDRARHGRYR